jgi:hypothetical protein
MLPFKRRRRQIARAARFARRGEHPQPARRSTSARERSGPGQCSRTSPRPATAAAAQAQSGTKHAERPGAGVPAGDEEHMANKAT